MALYLAAVVGESFDNDDGTIRSVEIGRCRAGESVTLLRDPDNAFDKGCVRVISARGIQIGNLEKGSWVSRRMDRHGYVASKIVSIHKRKGNAGVVLGVATAEDENPMDADGGLQDAPPVPGANKQGRSAKPGGTGILKLVLAAFVGSKRRR